MGFPLFLFTKINNFNLVEIMDHFLIHWFLPLAVLSLLLNSRKRIQSKAFRDFVVRDEFTSAQRLYPILKVLLLYAIPVLIGIGLFSRLF